MKLKSALLVAVMLTVSFLFTGCHSKITLSEILQPGVNEKFYTAHTIWYMDPEKISCLNIQQGSIIPIGTEIFPDALEMDDIVFHDKNNRTYRIQFDGSYRLTTKRDYVNSIITRKSPEELLAGISPKVQARIKAGEVIPGMTRKEVLLAYGTPAAIRTPSLKNETWIYWIERSRCVRVIFRGDIVRNVLTL